MIVPYNDYGSTWNEELKRYEEDTSHSYGVEVEYFGDGDCYMGRCRVRDEGRELVRDGNGGWALIARKSASIWAVKIEEEYRGMGHGSKMMVETMDMLKRKGFDDVYLICSGGIVARKAYERAGFVMTNEGALNNGRMDWVRPS